VSERFPADWLALREPVDHRSRAHALVEDLTTWLRENASAGRVSGADGAAPIEVVDLACGAGSNLRYLSPRLPATQSWTLIDHDDDLLTRAATGVDARHRIVTARRSLSVAGVDDVVDVIRPASADRPDVVTASALFDLVSHAWLSDLAAAVAASGAAALFTLSYDGSIVWSETDPQDALVRDAVNEHQRGDKGFGPALGPEAGEAIATCFEQEGYRVRTASSPWQLGHGDRELLAQLIDGWATAAIEQRPQERERIVSWQSRRIESIAGRDTTCAVGHLDVLALPPA
jgi:hypothetical protein